jgi:transposase
MVSEEPRPEASGSGEGVLTVEEAARILRIGRGTAYAQARRWRETNGREGLPVIVLGRSLRVPHAALQRLLELGVASADAGRPST